MTKNLCTITLSCLALLSVGVSVLEGQAVPGNLKATASGPTTVSLSWTAAPNANGYVIQRGLGTASLARLTPDKISGTSYSDAAAPAGSVLRYRVKAVYPNAQPTLSDIVSVTTPSAPASTATGTTPSGGGTTPGQPSVGAEVGTLSGPVTAVVRPDLIRNTAPDSRTFTAIAPSAESPAPAPAAAPTAADPSAFTAILKDNKVVLTWQAVPGIAWYLLGGPGMGQYGQQVQGISYTFESPGPGQHEWTVASLAGQGQGPINNWVNWPKASLNIESLTGRYRLSVAGLRVGHETLDDPWQWDGKRDEVYVSAFVQTFDRPSGQLLASGVVKSPIHGDVNGFPAGSRVRAGSASDLGGIETGDDVSPVLGQPSPGAQGYPLLVLWEGTLTSNREVVVVHPVLWEADKGDQNTQPYTAWEQFFVSNPQREWALPGVKNPDPQSPSWFQEGGPVRLSGAVNELMLIARNNRDRPIGLKNLPCQIVNPCGVWLDDMLILTRERIERALTSTYGAGEKGLIELHLTDYTQVPDGTRLAWNELQGDYVMLMKVDRIP